MKPLQDIDSKYCMHTYAYAYTSMQYYALSSLTMQTICELNANNLNLVYFIKFYIYLLYAYIN